MILLLLNIVAGITENITFGTPLGSNNGVIGYSNKDSENYPRSYYYIGSIHIGLKWHCVEYARR